MITRRMAAQNASFGRSESFSRIYTAILFRESKYIATVDAHPQAPSHEMDEIMQRNMKRFAAVLLVCLTLVLYPQLASADPLGDFEVTPASTGSYADGVLTITGDAQVSMADGKTSTSNRIVVASNATVTLDDVSIEASDEAAFLVKPGVTATLTLSGENSLTGGDGYAAVEPAWNKSGDTVTMADLTINGTGTLNATGGTRSAGIGGSKARNGVYGNITIKSGTINANGATDAAGIGSSDNPANGTSSGSYKYVTDRWGSITIDGGTITASATRSGAGIGGGNHSDSGEIVINGGDVTATGAAGIGAGLGSSKPDADGKKGPGYYYADVTINGGTVYAKANDGASGAGIGGGMYSDAIITITGGDVTAIGNYQNDNYHHGGAGIGGGYLAHAEVTITGGTVKATGGGAAAGIGSGAAPNSSTARGSSSRTGKTTCGSTTVTISGGAVTATGGPKGGAGIGGGVGADKVTVNISGGTVDARGGKSTKDAMQGGAGIGSAYNASELDKEADYMVNTDTSVSITGGDVLAIGGWGASGIGSGAKNQTATSITIDASNTTLEAYSDGTKFAIDTRQLNDDGSTTSITEGRNVTGDLLQSTFVKAYTQDDGKTQNPEGLKSIQVTNDSTDASKTLTKMPEGYRSFATDVEAAGVYTVFTDEESIGEGEGRYFSKCTTEEYDKSHVVERNVQFDAADDKLSDNYYLYPVKSVVVSKEFVLEDGLVKEDVDGTFYFALWIDAEKAYQKDLDGNIWVEAIKVEGGIPEGKAYFVDVDDKTFGVWEVADEQGTELPDVETNPVEFDTYVLTRITTSDSTGGTDNDANISPQKWTDKVTVTNTLKPKTGELDVSKAVVIPEGAEAPSPLPSFTFAVSLREADGATPLTGAYAYEVYDADGSKTGGSGTVSDGGTLSLADGQVAKIVGIPQGATYEVAERDAGSSWEVTSSGERGTISAEVATAAFTNTYRVEPEPDPETISLTVIKVWDDENDKDGIRPKTLEVKLSDGTTVTLSPSNKWTATVSNLPKFKDGKEIAYMWTEERLPNGYKLKSVTTKGSTTTITNVHTPSSKRLPKTNDPTNVPVMVGIAAAGAVAVVVALIIRRRND